MEAAELLGFDTEKVRQFMTDPWEREFFETQQSVFGNDNDERMNHQVPQSDRNCDEAHNESLYSVTDDLHSQKFLLPSGSKQ